MSNVLNVLTHWEHNEHIHCAYSDYSVEAVLTIQHEAIDRAHNTSSPLHWGSLHNQYEAARWNVQIYK